MIHHENCLKTMGRMPDDKINLVITSPPYDDLRVYDGNTFTEFEAIAKELYRVVKPGGVVVWVVGDQAKNGNESGTSFKQALYFKEIGFNLFDTMIYAKKPRGAVGNNKGYWQTFEYMFVFSKGQPETINLIKDRENSRACNGKNGSQRLRNGELKKVKHGGYGKFGRRTNIWVFDTGKGHQSTDEISKEHPATFPEALAQDHIITWSERGGIVYDPFCGSGTTAKMSILNGREFIGSEISAEYCKIIKRRLAALANRPRLLFDKEELDAAI